MGCTISKSTGGVRHAHATACNPTLPARHQGKLLEKPLDFKRDSTLFDSAYKDNGPGHDDTGLTRLNFASESEESDVFTDELSSDPNETCDTQTDDEPKDKEEEEEEILTPEWLRDEKFMADRAASKVQRSAERSAARETRKPEKEEQAESTIRKKARASRRRAHIEQRKAHLKAKRVHAKLVSKQQHEILCKNYDNLVRLDKEKQAKKAESHYDYLRNLKPAQAMDNKPNVASPDLVTASMQRLSRDLSRRAVRSISYSVDETLFTNVKNSDKSFVRGGSFFQTTDTETRQPFRRSASLDVRRSASSHQSCQLSPFRVSSRSPSRGHPSNQSSSARSIYRGGQGESGPSSPGGSSTHRGGATRQSEGAMRSPLRQISHSLQSSQKNSSKNSSRRSFDSSCLDDGTLIPSDRLQNVSQLLKQSLRRRTYEGAQRLSRSSSRACTPPPEQDDCRGPKSGHHRDPFVESLIASAQGSQAHKVRGQNEEKSTTTSEISSALENTKVEDTEEGKLNPRALYKQIFEILQPAFDKKILLEDRMRELIDADEGLPIALVASLLLVYNREQGDTLELIRKTIYKGDSLTQLKPKVKFSDTCFFLDKMQDSAVNLGDQVVAAICTKLRQICEGGDSEALENWPGKWLDLVRASQESASYYKRLLKFIKTHSECV